MQAHPFRLASLAGAVHQNGKVPLVDLCCKPTLAPSPAAARRRARLADLDPFMHCSVIGTCMSTTELRKLVPRYADLDRQHATDVEIHHAAVQMANEAGQGCKALQKALDLRYGGAVRKYDNARTPQALLAMWQDALKSGDIPAAYWALMTHAEATEDVRQKAFGDVHMLSHLVGAANRADIRRLMDLEDENAALKAKIERQQNRLHELSTERDAAVSRHAEQAAALHARVRPSVTDDAGLTAEVLFLREELVRRDQLLALHTHRRDAAQERALQEQETAATLRRSLDEALALVDTLQAEAHAIDRAMHLAATDDSGSALDGLRGKRVMYVGGRPGTTRVLKTMVETAGGELLVHDGGIEDRKGMFAAALPKADIVVFPVDCIDHDSMNTVKRVCDRHGIAYQPLRTASAACFIEFATRIDGGRASPASRFCLRHG